MIKFWHPSSDFVGGLVFGAWIYALAGVVGLFGGVKACTATLIIGTLYAVGAVIVALWRAK